MYYCVLLVWRCTTTSMVSNNVAQQKMSLRIAEALFISRIYLTASAPIRSCILCALAGLKLRCVSRWIHPRRPPSTFSLALPARKLKPLGPARSLFPSLPRQRAVCSPSSPFPRSTTAQRGCLNPSHARLSTLSSSRRYSAKRAGPAYASGSSCAAARHPLPPQLACVGPNITPAGKKQQQFWQLA